MKHEFIMIDVTDIPEQTSYSLRNGRPVICVDDSVIVNNAYFSEGFDTFKVSLKNRGEGLDYYGNTIIPTSSLEDFIKNIRQAQCRVSDQTIRDQLDGLIQLCINAKLENKCTRFAKRMRNKSVRENRTDLFYVEADHSLLKTKLK